MAVERNIKIAMEEINKVRIFGLFSILANLKKLVDNKNGEVYEEERSYSKIK